LQIGQYRILAFRLSRDSSTGNSAQEGKSENVQQLVSQRGKPALDEVKALRRWIDERNRTA
jgi:hypothetical protein